MIDFSEAFRRGYWHVSFYDKDDQIGCTMSSKDVKIASLFGLGKTAEEAFAAAALEFCCHELSKAAGADCEADCCSEGCCEG